MSRGLLAFLVLAICGPFGEANAQTGPGGVGNSTTNTIWLRADQGVTADANGVSSWSNQSGFGPAFTFDQADNTLKPQLVTGALNGRPVVRFSGGNHLLNTTNDQTRFSLDYTVFLVANARSGGSFITQTPTSVGGGSAGLYFQANNAGLLRFNHRWPMISTFEAGDNVYTGAATFTNTGSTTQIITGARLVGAGNNQHYAAVNSYQTTGTVTTGTGVGGTTNNQAINAASWLYLGGLATSGRSLTGDIAEVIFYNQALNTTQRTIVENYLAAKYNIALTAAGNFTQYQYRTTHGNDVAGVGRTSATDSHLSANSTSLLNASFATLPDFSATNNDYLFFGHDGAAATLTTAEPFNNDATYARRLSREWRFDRSTNAATNNLTLTFDLTGLSLPTGFNQWVLMMDADGDFTSGATYVDLSLVSGNTYRATVSSFTDGTHVTLGAIRRSVGFVSASGSDFESVATPTINLLVTYPTGASVTVPFSVNSAVTNPAFVGSDFTSTGSSITVSPAAGAQALVNLNVSPFAINVVNDATYEATSEGITITLGTPPTGFVAGNTTTFTYLINDDDVDPGIGNRNVTFTSGAPNTTSAIEGATGATNTISLQLQLPVGQVGNVSSVNYAVSGTATAGTDYVLLSNPTSSTTGRADIVQSTRFGTLSFQILGDNLAEANETIVITLTSASNASLDPLNLTYTFTITNDDATPTVSLATTNVSSALESAGLASYTINLSNPTDNAVTLTYALGGTAVNGTDYTVGASSFVNTGTNTITIPAGVSAVPVNFNLVNNSTAQVNRTLIFTLSAPVNATLGSPSSQTLTIRDDDGLGSTGPAGVGSSLTNRIWLRGDGYSAGTWTDRSGNAINFTAGTAPAAVASAALYNNQPVVQFTGTQWLQRTNFAGLNNEYSLFVVGDYSLANQRFLSGQEATAPAGQLQLFANAVNQVTGLHTSNTDNDGTGTDQAAVATVAAVPQLLHLDRSLTANLHSMRVGNGTATTDAIAPPPGAANAGGFDAALNLNLGRNVIGATNNLIGNIAEVILYDQPLNATQRNIVASYLAARYGLTITGNQYAGAPATHRTDVAGIGRESATDFHPAAQSAGLITISDAQDLGNGEYFLFGHDNAAATTWAATEAPANLQRLAREWYVQETGDVGTATFTFENLPTLPTGWQNLVLLVDADGNFSAGATQHVLTQTAPGVYAVSGVNVASGQYLAIAVQVQAPTINFVTATTVASEGAGVVSIQAVLSSAAPTGGLTINYTVGGTAAAGTDFTALAGSFTIAPGATTGSIDVTVLDPATVAADRTVTLTLAAGTGYTVGTTISAHTLTINENDLAFGNTGPGGVGAINDPTLFLWLRLDVSVAGVPSTSSVTTSGINSVTAWLDQSGNGRNFAQTDVSQRPLLVTNAIRGLPAIRFDGDQQELEYSLTGGPNSTQYSLFTVAQRREVATYSTIFSTPSVPSGGDRGLGVAWTNSPANSAGVYWSNGGSYTGALLSGTEAQDTWTQFTAQHFLASATPARRLFQNGQLIASSTSATAQNLSGGLTMTVGSGGPTPGGHAGLTRDFARVDVAEVILFSTALNTARRRIIENYLAAKYALGTSNSLYAYASTHATEVFGIGQETSADNHLSARGTGVMTVSNPTGLGDGEYLLIGHDNGLISTWSSTEAPNANVQRVAREWRVDKTGDLGAVTLAVDFATANGFAALPVGNRYVLLVDDDGNFSNGGTTIREMALVSGTSYQVTALNLNDGAYLSLGVVAPVVSFATTTASGLETVASASATVQVNYIPASNLSIGYAVDAASTATNGFTDFNLTTPGTVIIPAGQTSATLGISIQDDVTQESSETVVINLTSTPVGTIQNGTYTYTILDNDNPVRAEFQVVSNQGVESVTTTTATVRLNQQTTSAVQVSYTVSGTATPGGVDHNVVAGTVTIPAGDLSAEINLSIVDDAVDEPSETLVLTLTNAINANLGTNTVYTYTVLDNDDAPVVTWESSISNRSEGSGTVSVNIVLKDAGGFTATAGQDIAVPYSVTGGTALNGGVDYSLVTPGTVIIPAGASQASLNLNLINDAGVEVDETIQFTITAPSGGLATLGTPAVHTMTITDDDFFGADGPGGVGSIGASSNLAFWGKVETANVASSLTLSGSNVASWLDASGRGNHFAQGTAGDQPLYVANGLNSRPIIRFDGTSDWLAQATSGNDYAQALVNSEATFISVANRRQIGGNNDDYIVGAVNVSSGGQQGISFGFNTATTLAIDVQPTASATLTNATPNTWGIYSGVLNLSSGKSFFQDGVFLGSSSNTLTTISSTWRGVLGGPRATAGSPNGNYAFIDLAEQIIYRAALNTAQRTIVENYLAAKFGFSLAPAQQRYAHAGSHPNEVAGIGRESDGFHNAAKGTGVVRISNPNALDVGDYLMWGHDNQAINAWTTTEAASGTQRLAREWRVSETGDVGGVTVTVDASSFAAMPGGFTQRVLLVDDDGNFGNGGTQTYQLDLVSGSEYRVNNVNFTNGAYFTFGVFNPQVDFRLATSNVFENAGTAIVVVRTNFVPTSNVTVQYSTTGGTAGPGADYTTVTNNTITILAGDSTANALVQLINDAVVEGTESVQLTLTNPIGPSGIQLGPNSVHTLNINDEDQNRSIEFTSNGTSVTEGNTTVNATLTLVAGPFAPMGFNPVDAVNPTTVTYTVTGTATNGADYNLAAGTATIPAGSLTVDIPIPVLQDAISEAAETVILTLASPTNSNLGTQTTYTLTINDDGDPAPVVNFVSAASSRTEGSGTVNIPVTLNAEAGQTVSLSVAVSGTATGGGVDFNLASPTLTIPAGSQTANVQLTLNNDALIETDETVVLTLSITSGATAGTPMVHTFTISDDDLGFTGPGGVGNANTISFWYRGDAGFTAGSGATTSPVATWTDQSGNGRNTSAGGGTVANSISTSNAISASRTSVNFATGSYLSYPDPNIVGTGITILAVSRKTANNQRGIIGDNNGTNQLRFGYDNADAPIFRYNGTLITATGLASLNVNRLLTATYNIVGNGMQLHVDGTEPASQTGTANATLAGAPVDRYLGGQQSQTGGVNIGEIIFYRTNLNAAARQIVQSYLTARWGGTNATNRYAYGTTFGNDVAGIGRVDADNQHGTAQGGFVRVGNATGLDASNEFLMFGHNNGALTFTETTDVPAASGINRLPRVWRVTTTGSPGAVDLTIDAATLPALTTGQTYILLRDADGTFATGATSQPFTFVSGTEYQVTGVTFNDGDHFSIGVAINQTRQDGPFSDPNTWTLFVPTSADPARILHAVTLTANTSVGNITIDDDVATNGSLALGSFTLTLNNGTISLTGTQVSSTNFQAQTGSVTYAQTGTTQTVAALAYNNLRLENTGTKQLAGTISIAGNLTIANADFSTGSANLTLAGNWLRTGGSANLGTSTVTLTGSANQNISGGEAFNNLSVDKTGGLVQLNGTTTVNGTLTFTGTNAGVDIVLGNNNLVLGTAATVSGASTTQGYVQATGAGFLRKQYGALGSFTFPVGDASNLTPVTINLTAGTLSSAFIEANVVANRQPQTSNAVNYTNRYWRLQAGGITGAAYTGTLNYLDADVVGTESSLRFAIYNGGTWAQGNTTADVAANTVSNAATTTFGEATAAFDVNPAVLPVTWLSFTGRHVPELGNRLTWSTASELNSDYFEVQRSFDGVTWSAIGRVQAAGSSNAVRTYTFVDNRLPLGVVTYLYRLRQVDIDPTSFSYSRTIELRIVGEDNGAVWVAYPNPTRGDNLELVVISDRINALTDMHHAVLTTVQGQIVLDATDVLSTLQQRIRQVLSRSTAGVYVLTVAAGNHTQTFRLVKY